MGLIWRKARARVLAFPGAMRISAFLLLALLSLAGAASAQPEGSVARGEALVMRNCGMCHAVGRSGASPNAAAPPFRDLSMNYPIDDLAEGLAEGLLTGHPAMPEFRFRPAEVRDIIQYLKSVQVRRDASTYPAPVG